MTTRQDMKRATWKSAGTGACTSCGTLLSDHTFEAGFAVCPVPDTLRAFRKAFVELVAAGCDDDIAFGCVSDALGSDAYSAPLPTVDQLVDTPEVQGAIRELARHMVDVVKRARENAVKKGPNVR